MNNQRKHIQAFDHFWPSCFFRGSKKDSYFRKLKKTSLLIYGLHDIILSERSYPRQQAYYLILLRWPEPIYAPINVKPAAGEGGGGGDAGHGGGIWHF